MDHLHAQISDVLDGLPLSQAAQSHLDACGTCQGCLGELRAVQLALQALPPPVPSRSLVPNLHASNRLFRRDFRLAWLFTTAACLLLVGGGINVLSPQPSSESVLSSRSTDLNQNWTNSMKEAGPALPPGSDLAQPTYAATTNPLIVVAAPASDTAENAYWFLAALVCAIAAKAASLKTRR